MFRLKITWRIWLRPTDLKQAHTLSVKLMQYSLERRNLPGIDTQARRASLVRQMIDSLHRIDYVRRLGHRTISPDRANPKSDLFDPLKAAALHLQAGDIDEAAWLVFLSTHFGYHGKAHWRSIRMVYGALGGTPWTWARTAANPMAFRNWFEENAAALATILFGNHRKYESIRVDVKGNLADVVSSYVGWVGANRGHMLMFSDIFNANDQNPRKTFDVLYNNMSVARFGRTGRFDYLTMMGKLGVWDIDPPHPYFGNATGPVEGASLLFTNSRAETMRRSDLSAQVVELGEFLGLNMQVMEDSLCNWQKSPDVYTAFRG